MHTLLQFLVLVLVCVLTSLVIMGHIVAVTAVALVHLQFGQFLSPVGIVAAAPGIKGALDYLLIGGMLSWSFTVVNMIPLPILDGGKSYMQLLPERIQKIAAYCSVVLIGSLGVSMIVSDIVRIANHTLPIIH